MISLSSLLLGLPAARNFSTAAIGRLCIAVLGVVGIGCRGVIAQSMIVPDSTLGRESSTLQQPFGPAIDFITGGAVRGENLFHSFEEFTIVNQGAYFIISPDISNIFSRITGSNRSEIYGTLGTLETSGVGFSTASANLYLINPNGIVFGESAALDIGGSFSATTADGLIFENQGSFSSSDLSTPSQLLTIDPSAYSFKDQFAGSITNRSLAANFNSQGAFFGIGLGVSEGKNISLVGGNVVIDGGGFGGGLVSQGGNINVSAATGEGVAQIREDSSLAFSEALSRADITLENNAFVITTAPDGNSNISFTGRSVNTSDSIVINRMLPTTRDVDRQAGSIFIDASAEVNLDNTFVQNTILQNAVGAGGNIAIKTGSLSVLNGSFLGASLEGRGSAGNVFINAEGQVVFNNGSAAFSSVGANAIGNSGNIEIEANSLLVQNNSLFASASQGRGNSGNVLIDVKGPVIFENGGVASSIVSPDAVGNSGDVEISANSLLVRNNSFLTSGLQGRGNAGNIRVQAAGQVVFENGSAALASIEAEAIGNSGDITIESGSLSVSNGSQLASASKGQGNGGNILIMADGQVSFGSFSAVLSSIESKAVGNSGDILISSGSLSFAGGSQIGSAATGEGSAGNVSIDVDGKIIFDTGSSINSSVTAGRDSTGGDINIEAGELQVLGNSQFVSALQGQGNAGNISINVDGQVVFDNSRAFGIIAPNAEGDGGNIKIRANSLRLSNNSGISSSSFGRGSSGGISITANRRVELVSGSAALSSTAPGAIGNGGDINIEAGSLLVSDNSQIASNSQGRGDAGSVLIYVRDEAIFANNSSVLSSIEPGATGRGGDIVIRAESLNLAESSLISRSTGEGVPGDIRVSASRRLLTRNGEISTISTSTPGGSLFISANQIQLEQDSDISSRTFDRISDGGNVTIVADGFIIALDDSDIVAAAFQGKGGDVTLQTPGFFGQNFTPAPFGADPDTVDGNGRVDINATGSISGVVTVPGVSFLENDLTSLPDTLIASDPLVALSCISRAEDGQGTLINIGNGGLANSPSSDLIVPLSTGTVQAMPNSMATSAGIASDEAEVSIVEPTEIYRLADGRLVMSRECP